MTNPTHRPLSVLAVPAFKDNYLWLIHDGVHAAVVDPGDAAPVIAALAAHHLTLTTILLTHHHADHIGGVPDLLAHASVPVYGPRAEAIATVTVPLDDGELVEVPGLPLALRVLSVPGHTLGHIAFLREQAEEKWLFCGDTLFAGGCGRLFEGTPGQMRASLARFLDLPDNTAVYCAHEYTLANLRFAAAAEPSNALIAERIDTETAKRERGIPTVPTTIGLEKSTNPFLRDEQPGIVANLVALGKLAPRAPPGAAFAALRAWKNTF
ncbi:hydroxyacylglutathione hydrolase [Massilia sp. CCM 8733]|uniref:Hydroxyacylglutathione hydrolase n=1 Tax=Massilia mucilaginosa TaxID=2609282 RepID=A0ABX0NS73_9BURK|nr:hydroxyacylglutathione hydrolase [Massilia mucilaginosa]NHZ89650.1 hydroxyacylglutathione hydrolase [Massilia mucilaginosa]